ncbi:Pseudouridine synthase [Trypanosoma melophagium]|uniref:Pseudouridine synthase n=1 Tax=Trypanosoma melophagium TaxID=715481 RepID=UPI00351AA425|nr:Pseudouridine synthase [Trypanosoma melophagium]
MKATNSWRRRLILGMSIEDARSKFDSPESRVALRLAHERYNQGIYHELNLAQRQRNRLPPERKCHLVRHTKPSVKGFQGYIKSCPEDYVVREIWQCGQEEKEKLGSSADNDDNNSDNKKGGVNTTAGVAVNNNIDDKGDLMQGRTLDTSLKEDAAKAQIGGISSNSNSNNSEDAEYKPQESECITTTTTTTTASSETVVMKKDAALGNVGRSTQMQKPEKHRPIHIGQQVALENNTYEQHRSIVLAELVRVAEALGNDARQQLGERREQGTLLPMQHNSLVDRLVDNAKEAKDKGYTSLSSSSHLLEPLGLSMNICGKKEKHLLEAFRSPLLCLPAEENHISLSLWVSGSLIAQEELSEEFPYHIAKHAEPELDEDGTPISSSRLPRASVEVYFSPELYQLQQTVGKDGVLALRRFIGRVMRRQHDPLPTASSILLNMRTTEQEASSLCTGETTRIPWLHLIKTKVASVTGVVLEMSSEDAPAVSAMREAVQLVWRIWGNLVKDLHVHGDLDYLYVSVWPKVEIPEVRREKQELENKEQRYYGNLTREENADVGLEVSEKEQQQLQQQHCVPSIRSLNEAVEGLILNDSSVWKGFKSRKSNIKTVLLPADFVVVECLLEKKGLPHRLVVEDMVETLTELQRQSLEMQRLSVVENNTLDEDEIKQNGGAVRPVLYAPKITVSHAGVIEAAAHGFQRIRIRGSCLAHVEALARALQTGEHFTDRVEMVTRHHRGVAAGGGNNNSSPTNNISSINSSIKKNVNAGAMLELPPNLSFSSTHSETQAYASGRRLLGHRIPSNYAVQRTANGRFHTHQTLRPLQHMIVNKEEREFWSTHYYRLSNLRLVFHDRVSAADVADPTGWSSSLKEQLLTIGKQRSSKQQHERDEHETMMESTEDTDEVNSRNKKNRKKKLKSKKVASTVVALEEVVASMTPEKIFEYLCIDMEVESATYDFLVGDNDGYAYNVKLRRIPQSHLSLVKPAINSVVEKGFINYFGPQRFATYTKHNMHPGLHLLKGEFRAAASIIVQQFSMDADLAAEKRRTGAAFPKMYHAKGMGFRLSDLDKSYNSKRSITEHGTALQSILDSALQASAFIGGGDDDEADGQQGKKGRLSVDPCAEAFLHVVGPKACLMLVHEFLAFVWNDIVNQRLQRYGTFAILPGDLVRKNPLASPHSEDYGRVVYASKKEIDRGEYSFFDVVLPLPGVGVQLPDNHTTDLYIVTLKRLGIPFNPETRQWDIFKPRYSFTGEESPQQTVWGTSPYRRFSSSFALMEEELGSSTTIVEPIDDMNMEGAVGGGDISLSSTTMGDASHLRSDLRQGQRPGNPLGVNVCGFYRHVLINPSSTLTWRMHVGQASYPHKRWAQWVRQAFAQNDRNISVCTENSSDGDGSEQQLFIGRTNTYRTTPPPTTTIGGVIGTNSNSISISSGNLNGMRSSHAVSPAPYWLAEKSDGCLELTFELPSNVYPGMLLREITKSDVNSPDTVDLDRPLLDTRAKSWNDLTADQQAKYRRYLAQKRQKLFTSRPRAINVALLHQQIFRSSGMRRSLMPSMRGFDNVSK